MKQISTDYINFLSICILLAFSNVLNAQEISSRDLSSSINVDALLYHEDGSIFASGGWDGSNIYKIAPDGTVSVFASGFVGIVDMVWGDNDTIIGSSYQNGRLLKIAPDGSSTIFVQSSVGVASLYKDYNGDIICTINPGLAHPNPGKVIKVTPEGNIITFASGGSIYKPSGATQDEEGNYYISNLGDGRITKINTDGTQELFATIPATGQWKIGYLKFWKGSLFSSAISENKIYKTTLVGEVTVFAGDGEYLDKDGIVPDVSFKNPNGMAVSGDTLFIISAINSTNKIRYAMDLPSSIEEEIEKEQIHHLEINYPNPFNSATQIKYDINRGAFVQLKIYNSIGQLINTLVSSRQPAGNYSIQWNGNDANGNAMVSGIYFYELSAGRFVDRNKMLLLR